MQLCKMAEAVLAAVSGSSSALVPSEQFRRARQIFFADYAYVLRLTGPGFADMEAPTVPDDFHEWRVASRCFSWERSGKRYIRCYCSQSNRRNLIIHWD